MRTRTEALALLDDIADRGEGDADMPRSHFSTFLDMFNTWPDDDAVALDVPTDPSTRPRSEPAEDPGLIKHERALAWATIFNRHYRILLGWLQHALLTPHADPVSSGLCLRVFGEMLVLVGKLVDIDPYGLVSQVFFDELIVGVSGRGGGCPHGGSPSAGTGTPSASPSPAPRPRHGRRCSPPRTWRSSAPTAHLCSAG